MTPAFFTLHKDLPREGPGDRASLDWALGLAGVTRDARILDAACGPGADIAALLHHAPDGHVTAMDRHAPFLDQVRASHGTDDRVTIREGDMADPGGPYDLIWCAGALYFLGITDGLRAWRDALAPGGVVAFSELVWLSETRDAALVAELEAEYPAIGTIATLAERVAEAGYETLGCMVLSDAAWEAYYTPMEARIAALRPTADADLAAMLDEGTHEIAQWRKYRSQFGYALSLVRPT